MMTSPRKLDKVACMSVCLCLQGVCCSSDRVEGRRCLLGVNDTQNVRRAGTVCWA